MNDIIYLISKITKSFKSLEWHCSISEAPPPSIPSQSIGLVGDMNVYLWFGDGNVYVWVGDGIGMYGWVRDGKAYIYIYMDRG